MLTDTPTFVDKTSQSLAIPKSKVPVGYFRSKLYIAPYTTNPLLSAASPLFSLLERLTVSGSLPTMNSIHSNIEHELYAFHSKLSAASYSDELISMAHFLICATIDELLGKSYVRLYGKNTAFKAFTPASPDQTEPHKLFFDILSFIKDKPTQYLDLIELTYYCLIAGFEGEQHMKPDGRQTLDDHIEDLYTIIQRNRVHIPLQLIDESQAPKSTPKNHKPMIFAALVSIGIIVFAMILSQKLIKAKTHAIQSGHYQQRTVDLT